MAKKYYAVKSGHKPGIYESWDVCKQQVHGFPGATFKSFPTRNEAEAFMELTVSRQVSVCKTRESGVEQGAQTIAEAVAYVDGSYEDSVKAFSYGMVMFANGEEEHFAEMFQTPDLVAMRNVAGEILGAQKAMQYCIDHDIHSLDIYYDYEGIEKWCTGVWKANKDGTKRYKAFYDGIKGKLEVHFHKVAAHTGDTYNELADKLAKSAIKKAMITLKDEGYSEKI